jgi:hypothetical protein
MGGSQKMEVAQRTNSLEISLNAVLFPEQLQLKTGLKKSLSFERRITRGARMVKKEKMENKTEEGGGGYIKCKE